MAQDILGGRLSIEDGFTSPLDKFANQILGAENRYKKFADGIINSNRKIENSMNQTFNNLEKIANKFVANENKVSNAINNANNKVRQNQEKNIDGLIQRYGKLGEAIKGAYSTGDKVSISNPKGGGSSGNSSSDPLKDFAQNFLQGGFSGIIGKLGPISAGVTATVATMKAINGWMEQGFNALNKFSDGLFSAEGIKSAIEESMDFETGRMKLNLFTGSDEKGLKAYQDATYVAQKTYAGERDTVEISAKLAQLGVDPTRDQLERLIDVGGTRPEVQTDHIGLAVKEAIEGRVAMMQMYGINNRTLKSYYDSLKKSDPNEYKALKGSLNKEGTAGNPQKYFNLLTDYIKQSPMNGYADRYANQTMQGKVERMGGVWETLKGEIMGIDVSNGIERKGGVFDAVGDMVTNLEDKLKDKSTLESLQKVGDAFGHVFTSIGNAFTKALTPQTLDKIADAIVRIGESLAKMINKFVDSGQLDNILDKLPALIEKILGGEAIKKTTDFQVYSDIMQGHFIDAGYHKLKGTFDWADNVFGLRPATDIVTGDNDPTGGVGTRYKPSQQSTGFAPLGFIRSWMLGDQQLLTDANASTAIDKNKNLTDDQKQSLKNVISSDNVSTYNITIGEIKANNFNEIVKSIQESAQNRK